MERRSVGFLILGYFLGHVGMRGLWHLFYCAVIVFLLLAWQGTHVNLTDCQAKQKTEKAVDHAQPNP